MTEDDTAIISAPTAVITALIFVAPRRPQRSIMTLALTLPTNPPTVNMEVTTEKVESDMGMQSGRPYKEPCSTFLHVRTACIWFSAEIL